jgi:hypothetical protein
VIGQRVTFLVRVHVRVQFPLSTRFTFLQGSNNALTTTRRNVHLLEKGRSGNFYLAIDNSARRKVSAVLGRPILTPRDLDTGVESYGKDSAENAKTYITTSAFSIARMADRIRPPGDPEHC